MEFSRYKSKKECVDNCTIKRLNFYQQDLNEKHQKTYIATTHDAIYDKIKRGEDNFYESWYMNQPLKLCIDYDKKISKESPIDDTHINDIINIINTVKSIIQVDHGIEKFCVYILKSFPDTDKKSYHIIFEGFHFPNYKIIKNFVEDKLKLVFPELFDKKIIDTHIYAPLCLRVMFCSKFGQKRPLLLLDTKIFMDTFKEITLKDNITVDIYKSTCITSIGSESILIQYKPEKKKTSTSKKVHLMNESDIYTDKDIIKKYLDILDPSRYSDRNKWLNVGYIIHSINLEYIDLWHYFSSKWEGYNEQDTNIAWNSFNNGEYVHTVHNLIHLAKIDNVVECNELTKEIPDHDIRYLRPFDNIISKLIYRLYGDKFVCSDPEKNKWYHFGVLWVKENKSHNLRKLIINDVFAKVEEYRRSLVKDGVDEELIKNYHYILKILGSGIKLNCLELEFYNSKFHKILDQNKDLLGFDDGVFDLNIMEFRTSVPSDYVSMTVGYEYKRYKKTDFEYIRLTKLIEEILPEKSVREFTMKALASCLDGHIRDENFYIFTGKNSSGGNGKSTIMELTQKALGEYSLISPVTLLTSKPASANNANSALAATMNKRLIVFQEPDASEQIQASVMKGLTGGDKISTRELNSSQITFNLHAKLFLCSNSVPPISGGGVDGGVARRIKITEYTSRFVDNPSTTDDGIKEYKIDRTLKSKIDSYGQVFMSILIDYYALYKEEGLTPPDAVLVATKKYENDNNAIKYFIDENIIKDKTGTISKNELKEFYKSDSILRTTFRKFIEFSKQFEIYTNTEFRMDKKKVYRVTGYSIRVPDADDSDCEEFIEIKE